MVPLLLLRDGLPQDSYCVFKRDIQYFINKRSRLVSDRIDEENEYGVIEPIRQRKACRRTRSTIVDPF